MTSQGSSDSAATAAGKVKHRSFRREWVYGIIGLALGAVIGRSIPPPYPDGSFWFAFFTSAGFGGSMAVIGAGIAAWIAWQNSQRDRQQRQEADDRDQWWSRFVWACEASVSGEPGRSEVGISVLSKLLDAPWATPEDNELALDIAAEIANSGSAVPAVPVESEKTKRWWKP